MELACTACTFGRVENYVEPIYRSHYLAGQ